MIYRFGVIVLGILSFMAAYRMGKNDIGDSGGKLAGAAIYNAAHGLVFILINLWACFQGYDGLPMMLMEESSKLVAVKERFLASIHTIGMFYAAYGVWIALFLLVWLFGKNKKAKLKLCIITFLTWFSIAGIVLGFISLFTESKSMLMELLGTLMLLPAGVVIGLEMAWPFLSVFIMFFPNTMKALSNPIQAVKNVDVESGGSTGASADFDLSRMPRIIYDSSNQRWQEQYTGDKLSRLYRSDSGEEVVISHAQVSGSSATTNVGNFHWY